MVLEEKHQDAWSEDSHPQEKNKRWPKKEGAPGSSRTSGSYVQRQRLAKMREQNPPKTKEEAEQQRLAAIGRAKFQRIHGRQQKQMAAKMEEQQAKLDMQQQQLQQLQQQLYWQQSQQTQWQWQQPAVSWVLPQSGYLIHPGLALVISLSGMLFCNHDFLSFIFSMHLAFVLFQVVVVVAAPWPLVVLPPPQAHFVSEQFFTSTEDRGDCCMLSIVEWGHARLEYEEDVNHFCLCSL